ncbi:MAG: phosphoadenosine phosphosulfate reductase, partial [Neobacillus sp.]|nr:phosphoadenosine phosphosulfate reductase [Neobacillus sp.]
MWCKNCNIDTNESTCPICGENTVEDLPVEIYWCSKCKTPIIHLINHPHKGSCPICGEKTKYMAADIRPVFPEERLLIEILLGKEPNEWVEKSVWAANSRYYIDGKSIALSSELFQTADTDQLAKKLDEYKIDNSYTFFNHHIKNFIK